MSATNPQPELIDAALPLTPERADFAVIADWVRLGERVLDLGCEDGALLNYLTRARGVRGCGVEISTAGVQGCLARGVNVIQSNLDEGLSGFKSDSFDLVILSQTLQAMRNTETVVAEMLRVGREAIVTFPNFGYWRHRVQIGIQGRMPVSKKLPYQWYDTPNIHLFTVTDFDQFCAERNYVVSERLVLHEGQRIHFLPNVFGSTAVFRIRRG